MNTSARPHRPFITETNPTSGAQAAAAIVIVDPSIQGTIRTTESFKIKDTTRKDYCNRSDKVISWIETQVNQGKLQTSVNLIRDLTYQGKDDKDNYNNFTRLLKTRCRYPLR